MIRLRSLGLVLVVLAGAPVAVRAAAAQTAPACPLSIGDARGVAFIWTPPEELTSMAWKIPVESCAACASYGLWIKTVSFRVRWTGPCVATAQISIVGARTGASCLEPDTANVLCPAVPYPIAGTGNASVTYTLPVPGECCVSGDAFLFVRFSGFGGCASTISPGLAASTAGCTPCDQFVTASHIYPDLTEWCSIGATNETWFAIEADCCAATPTHRTTWGSLKTIYR